MNNEEVKYFDLETTMSNLSEWKARVMKKEAVVRIRGFEKLSEAKGGFNPGRVDEFLASTGFGKTNFGLQLALKARLDMPTFYSNLEMGISDVAKRIAVLETGVTYRDFYNKVLDSTWGSTFENKKGFYVTDGRCLSPKQIMSTVRTISKINPIRFLVVDYDLALDLPTSRDVPEWKAMQTTLAQFDDFAKEMNCAVLVLGQVNRDSEIASSHRSTFKAHSVMHFKDDETHGPLIHLIKNRHGEKDKAIRVDYNSENSRITEIEEIIVKEKKKEKRTIKTPKPFEMKPHWQNGD